LIQLWKLKREAAGFWQRLRIFPDVVAELPARSRNERAFAAGLPIRQGLAAPSPRVALILIFQRAGVAGSVIETCRHLQQRGYAVFVVSNTPVSRGDWARLEPHVWQLVERGNFGRDFGGYRDGIRLLLAAGPHIEMLLILNDSIWFPLWPDETLLDRIESSEADIAGPVMRSDRSGEKFLESYFLGVKRAAIHTGEFRRFWEVYKPTSNKLVVVRKGEIGFSAAMRAAGCSIATVYGRDEFLAGVAAADLDFLERTLRHSAHSDPALVARSDDLLTQPRDGAWRDRALAHVRDVVSQRPFHCNFPFAAVRLMGYPVLKKTGDRMNSLWRRAFVSAVEAGDIPQPIPAIYAEIAASLGR